jgi:Fe-S cluster assembly protein SufB
MVHHQSVTNDTYQWGFHDLENYSYKAKKGLSEKLIEMVSHMKKEPVWMLEKRLAAYEFFKKSPLPAWGPDLSKIDFDDIYYYVKPIDKPATRWEDLPEEIRHTYDRIGVPEAEKQMLIGGVSAQYESEVVYKSIEKTLAKQGVIFMDMDSGLREYPDLVKKYFGSVIPFKDNKFASLNSAIWSGGSFIYVPKGVKVGLPLQAYFRINTANIGQFERTLIIADEGSFVHYVEGCTAPIYTTDSLHAAVVEIIVKPRARVRYTTIQNWSGNVYNLVTKRMRVEEEGIGEWVDGNLGSKVTMKYPACILAGKGAHGEVLSIAYAGKNMHQDTGAKMIHAADDTSSIITSKSISKDSGRASYRGLVHVVRGIKNVKSKVVCDALLLDDASRSDTYPTMNINDNRVNIEHEATVSKIGEEQLFYLMSRGLSEPEASAMIVGGFIEPIVKELPLEYAVELNRLIELQMEGTIG